MPVIIRRKLPSFILKKRHLSFIVAIVVIVIMVFRASSVAYHFHALTLSKLVIEQVKILRNPPENSADANSDHLKIQVVMNISKCTCPLFLEIMDINGMVFLSDKDPEALHVTINNIEFGKQKEFQCDALLKFDTSEFKKPLLDLYNADFIIEFSFLIRTRFCLIPLCFSKVLRRRKSDLITKIENSVGSSVLKTRIHTLDNIPCVQFGVTRKLLHIINASSNFIFDVGCVKLSLGGILDLSIIITSFSVNMYADELNAFEIGEALDNKERLKRLTSMVPGVLREGEDESRSIFYFVSIPLYSFGELVNGPNILRKIFEERVRILRIEKISVLLEDDKEDALEGFIDEEKRSSVFMVENDRRCISLIRRGAVEEGGGKGIEKGWRLNDLILFNIKEDKGDEIKQIHVHNFNIKETKFSFQIGFNREHPIYRLLKGVSEILEMIGIGDSDFTVSFNLIFNERRCIDINGTLTCNSINGGSSTEDIVEVTVDSIEELVFRMGDMRKMRIELVCLSIGGHSVLFRDAFHFTLDYPYSVNVCASGMESYAVHEFKRGEQQSIAIKHQVSNHMRSNILKVVSIVDMSTYGFRDRSNLIPVGNSFLRLEIPEISIVVTNPFIKIKLNPQPTILDFSLGSRAARGSMLVESFILLTKEWDWRLRFEEAFMRDDINFGLLNLRVLLKFSINELVNTPTPLQPMAVEDEPPLPKNRPFITVLPIELTLVGLTNNLLAGTIMIRHTCKPGDSCPIVSYMQCKDHEMYRNHGLYPSFARCGHTQLDFGCRVDGPFYIKNILQAEKISYVVFVSQKPLISFEVENGLAVISVTSKNLFIYLPQVVLARMKFMSPEAIKEYKRNPPLWIKKYPLHVLIDFVVEAISRNPHGDTTLRDKPQAGQIEVNVSGGIFKKDGTPCAGEGVGNTGGTRTGSKKSVGGTPKSKIISDKILSFSFWVKIPRNQIKKIDCIALVPFGEIEFRPEKPSTDPFYILFKFVEDINFYSVELQATFPPCCFNKFLSTYVTFKSSALRKTGHPKYTVNTNNGIFDLNETPHYANNISLKCLYDIGYNFIKYFKSIKAPSVKEVYAINYESEEFIRAFGRNEFFYGEEAEVPNSSFSECSTSLCDLCTDLCINGIKEKGEGQVELGISANLDAILLHYGCLFGDFLCSLPLSAIPHNISVSFQFMDPVRCLSTFKGSADPWIRLKIMHVVSRGMILIPLRGEKRADFKEEEEEIIEVKRRRLWVGYGVAGGAVNWTLCILNFFKSPRKEQLMNFKFKKNELSRMLMYKRKLSDIPRFERERIKKDTKGSKEGRVRRGSREDKGIGSLYAGTSVGSGLGNSVGSGLGNSVGSGLGTSVGNSPSDSVGNSPSDTPYTPSDTPYTPECTHGCPSNNIKPSSIIDIKVDIKILSMISFGAALEMSHVFSEPIESFRHTGKGDSKTQDYIAGIFSLDENEEPPPEEKPKTPFIVVNVKDMSFVAVSLRVPFTVRFLGGPAYLTLQLGEGVIALVRMHGAFMDAFMALNGYFLSIPIALIRRRKDGSYDEVFKENDMENVIGHSGKGGEYSGPRPEEYLPRSGIGHSGIGYSGIGHRNTLYGSTGSSNNNDHRGSTPLLYPPLSPTSNHKNEQGFKFAIFHGPNVFPFVIKNNCPVFPNAAISLILFLFYYANGDSANSIFGLMTAPWNQVFISMLPLMMVGDLALIDSNLPVDPYLKELMNNINREELDYIFSRIT